MRRHLAYLTYVVRHKWFVLVESLRLGVPLWRALAHDWDKFLPDEWGAYARTFYNEDGSKKRYAETPEFMRAWWKHQRRNKHHWQRWLLVMDRGETIALAMPDAFRREMLADWRGAGRALGFPNTLKWYSDNRHRMILHAETREWVDIMLGYEPKENPE